MCQEISGLERVAAVKVMAFLPIAFSRLLAGPTEFILEILRGHKSAAAQKSREKVRNKDKRCDGRRGRKCIRSQNVVASTSEGRKGDGWGITGSFNTCSALFKADMPQPFECVTDVTNWIQKHWQCGIGKAKMSVRRSAYQWVVVSFFPDTFAATPTT
jgi:hypothetical protein